MAGTLGVTETNGSEPCQLVAGDVFEQKEIIVTTGAGVLARGHVLGLVTASLEYDEMDPDAVNGTEVARAILAENVDATSADVKAQAYFVGKYRLSDLQWHSGITDAQKNAALLELQDRGILVDGHFI